MTEKDLFEAIHQCEDTYIEEVAEEQLSWEKKNRGTHKKKHCTMFRTAAAILLCILALGMGVSTIAIASDTFREWLLDIFSGHQVTTVQIENTAETGEKDRIPDIPADENQMLSLKNGMQIYGNTESFICKVHYENEGEKEVVEKIYAIQGNSLRELPIHSFRGEYDGIPYSFDYAIIGNEIFGCNETGYVEILPYKMGDNVYISPVKLGEEESIIQKECLVEMNLKTNEATQISNDKMICNFLMIPDGKRILCNHRSDGYWSVFDIETRTEKKIDALNGYLHTDEIKFLDPDTVLAYGDFIETKQDDGSIYLENQTYKINLNTGEIMEIYVGAGDIDPEWNHTIEGNTMRFDSILTGESVTVKEMNENYCISDYKGNYLLLEEEREQETGTKYCLVNLEQKTSMKINIPKEMEGNIEMHLAVSEKKLLLTNGTEAYIVDVSQL